jgi:hypothetical protein
MEGGCLGKKDGVLGFGAGRLLCEASLAVLFFFLFLVRHLP